MEGEAGLRDRASIHHEARRSVPVDRQAGAVVTSLFALVVLLLATAVVGCGLSAGSASQGTVFKSGDVVPGVRARPFSIRCPISNSSVAGHWIEVGNHRWETLDDDHLEPGKEYVGDLHIVKSPDSAPQALYDGSRAEFRTGDVAVKIAGVKATCE